MNDLIRAKAGYRRCSYVATLLLIFTLALVSQTINYGGWAGVACGVLAGLVVRLAVEAIVRAGTWHTAAALKAASLEGAPPENAQDWR